MPQNSNIYDHVASNCKTG